MVFIFKRLKAKRSHHDVIIVTSQSSKREAVYSETQLKSFMPFFNSKIWIVRNFLLFPSRIKFDICCHRVTTPFPFLHMISVPTRMMVQIPWWKIKWFLHQVGFQVLIELNNFWKIKCLESSWTPIVSACSHRSSLLQPFISRNKREVQLLGLH